MNRWNDSGIVVFGIALAVAASAAFGSAPGDEEIWPQFRGSHGAGVANGQRVPVNLSKETLRWSAPLPGPGSSSPVVWGDRMFVTSEIREEGRILLSCLDARNGRMQWTVDVEGGDYKTHNFNNLASGTPCVTSDVVVLSWYDVASANVKLSAYSHSGKLIWTRELGAFDSQHGSGFSPVAHDDRIIVGYAHLGGGYIGAFRLEDGSPIWSVPNPSGGNTSYAAPLVREVAGTDSQEIVFVGQLIGMVGLDFETGKTNWSLQNVFPARTISSPIIVNGGTLEKGALVAAGCKNDVYFATRVPQVANGETITEPRIEWSMETKAPYVTTPVADGRSVYALHDGGMFTAMDSETGKPHWQERLVGNFYASPVLVDGKLYCLSRKGEMWVVEAGKEFKVLAKSAMNPPEDVAWCDATPAVAHNRLYVRLGSRLDCY